MPLETEPSDFIMDFNEPSLEVGRITPYISTTHSPPDDVSSLRETVMTSIRRKVKKSVTFRTETVYYFPRAQGHSSIPSQDGPTLGMIDRHVLVESFDLVEKSDRGVNDHWVEHPAQGEYPSRLSPYPIPPRGEENRPTPPPLVSIDPSCGGLDRPFRLPVKKERFVGGTMLPVPPRQRRKLLRDAGVLKVDAAEEVEARQIRSSRMLCGCCCKGVCRPDTCLCSQSDIPCQVDRGSFPCACTALGCGNPSGRHQFDLAYVRRQRVLRLAQLQGENGSIEGGCPALDVISIELIISPAKRTRPSESANSRKRVSARKQPIRRNAGKRIAVLGKPETECSGEWKEKLQKVFRQEADYETVRHENPLEDTGGRNASSQNDEERLLALHRTQFREPVQECVLELGRALESVDAVPHKSPSESDSMSIDDVSSPRETSTCCRAFDLDLDPENDLDPNCLEILVIGNDCLETSPETHSDSVGQVELRDDLRSKDFGLILESDHDLDLKSDLQSPLDLGLECEVVMSKNDLLFSVDRVLDMTCDVGINLRSQPSTLSQSSENAVAIQSIDIVQTDFTTERDLDLVSNDLDLVRNDLIMVTRASENAVAVQSSDIVQTDFTTERDLDLVGNDLDMVSNDLHSAFNVNSVPSRQTQIESRILSCRDFLSRFLQKHPQKADCTGLTSQVTQPSEACISSQGHSANSEGHLGESRDHCVESQGHYIESQHHHIEFQGHCIKREGHQIESQGHFVESQDHQNVLNDAQVTEATLTVGAASSAYSDVCQAVTEANVKDFCWFGSPFEAILLREVPSSLEEVSSTPSSTLEDESSTSKEEDSSPSQFSDGYEFHINMEDDLTAGSLLEAGSVSN